MHVKPAHILKYLIISMALIAVLTLSGCSSPIKRSASISKGKPLFSNTIKQTKIQKKLTKHFIEWENTPYKFGSTSKNGVDCSGYIYVTFRDVFNKKVPRSTELLARTGKNVASKNLKFGDLVFFKTGANQRHAGIYTSNGSFIHASTSRGVMQSQLSSPYWRKHYWKAKRIIK